MEDWEALGIVVDALREITKLPAGAEREARVSQLAADPALLVLADREERVVLSLMGLAFAT